MDDFAKGRRIDVGNVVKTDIPLPEPEVTRPVADVPPEVQALAEKWGFTISKSPQLGGMRIDGLKPEEISMLEKALGHGRDWEFTDKRADSPTAGYTFYVPEGTSAEEIGNIGNAKIQSYLESKASRAEIDENTLVQQEILDRITAAGAKTTRQVQELLSNMGLKRQEAAELRRRAWNENAQKVINEERGKDPRAPSADQEAENSALKASGKTLTPEQIEGAKVSPNPDPEKIKSGARDIVEVLDEAIKKEPEVQAVTKALGEKKPEPVQKGPMRDPKTGRFMKAGAEESVLSHERATVGEESNISEYEKQLASVKASIQAAADCLVKKVI
jgi:hypothetical protein